jgi:ribosomal protein S18 acetylase RimI-like enzyme
MEGMVNNSNLMVTAWSDGALVGIARSMTDFHYACYISDLAVHREYQKTGIGKNLLAVTQGELGPKCKLILVAAPAANSYYEHLGFEKTRGAGYFIVSSDARLVVSTNGVKLRRIAIT